jgi:hypothetical protein
MQGRTSKRCLLTNDHEKKEDDMPYQVENIEQHFRSKKRKEPFLAAQLAYVIAMTAKRDGNEKKVIEFGQECVRILNNLNLQTQDQCTPTHNIINGIPLPEILHAAVVCDRLKPFNISACEQAKPLQA